MSDDLDATAERCMAPLKNLLARYRALEGRIATAVEATEKERLAIQFGRAVTKSHAAGTLLRFRLNPRDKDGKTLYRKMLTGDFADAMTAGMDDGNDAIALESCVFKRMFERKVISGLTFNLFGREIASRRALSTKLKAEHAVGGQINIFEAEGEVSEAHVAFGEGQSMRVSSLMNFITAPDAPDAFAVQLNYTDKNMKPKELRQYLKSLEDAGFTTDGATERITEASGEFGAPGEGRRSLTDRHRVCAISGRVSGNSRERRGRDRPRRDRRATEVLSPNSLGRQGTHPAGRRDETRHRRPVFCLARRLQATNKEKTSVSGAPGCRKLSATSCISFAGLVSAPMSWPALSRTGANWTA